MITGQISASCKTIGSRRGTRSPVAATSSLNALLAGKTIAVYDCADKCYNLDLTVSMPFWQARRLAEHPRIPPRSQPLTSQDRQPRQRTQRSAFLHCSSPSWNPNSPCNFNPPRKSPTPSHSTPFQTLAIAPLASSSSSRSRSSLSLKTSSTSARSPAPSCPPKSNARRQPAKSGESLSRPRCSAGSEMT